LSFNGEPEPDMSNPRSLLETAERIVGWAVSGAEVEAYVAREQETEVRAYQGEVESLTSATSVGVGVRVVRDGRQGFAYAATLDETTLRDTFDEALDNSRFGSVDEYAGVAEPDGVEPVSLDLYRSDLLEFASEDKVALALELERIAVAADPRVTAVESAEYADTVYEGAVATSRGVAAQSRETGCYLVAYTLASNDDETQTGFGFSVGRSPGELMPDKAGNEAAERATRLLGATKPETCRLTVVLDPYVTAQLLGIVGATLSGDAVLKGRSFFAQRMGDAVAAESVTLVDDATDPEAFTASAIDAEGLATRRVPLISNGVLQSFLYDSYTARRAGVSSTGSAVRGGFKGTPGVGAHALRLKPGLRSQAEIVSGIDDGFLVQGVSGLHSGVNAVSGDFSAGAEGLRIRNGEIAEAIREVTIASTIQRLLLDVTEVGSDLEWLPMSAAGVSLAVADVTMSGA